MLRSFSQPLPPAPAAAPRKLRAALASALGSAAVESAASFGRWWFDTETAQIVLSARAAHFLEVEAGLHRKLEDCLIQVVPDDVLMLLSMLSQELSKPVDCEFRIVNELDGLRWIHMQSLPPGTSQRGVRTGVLTDITAAKHAALRERFSFESTQILIGTSTLETAVVKVIELVCENLGWEWGAFWAVDAEPGASPRLACRHFWHAPHFQLDAFTRASASVRMAAGEGLVGQVWGTGQAGWVEDIANHPTFLRRKSAAECALRSGYAFPVAYVSADGQRRSPGVLEFFSTISRQREAQLPNLSTAIGTLIAQTDERFKQQEHNLQASTQGAGSAPVEQRLAGMMESIEEVLWTFEVPGWAINYVSPAVERVYGHARQAFYADPHLWLKSVHPADRAHVVSLSKRLLEGGRKSFQYRIVRPDKEVRWIRYEAYFVAGALPGTGRIESVGIDISEQHRLETALRQREHALEYQAHYDALTGLPNRVLLHERLGEAIADLSCARWLVYLDLDRFKVVNDSLGHKAGDLLLKQVAGRLRAAVNPADTVARLGGDEFVMILSHPDGGATIADALQGIADAVAQPVRIEGLEFFPTCSMGIASWPADGKDEATLMRHADIAMYRAKELGRNNYQFYSRAMDAMSARQFGAADLADSIITVLEQTGLAADSLDIELTESSLMADVDSAVASMRSLKAIGVHLSIDDFGTGYSSLSYLKRFPIDLLKIDKSFVRDVMSDPADAAIVASIISLAHNLKLQVIAEGVETAGQVAYLRRHGCDDMQGYYFSEPLPAAAFERLLAAAPRASYAA